MKLTNNVLHCCVNMKYVSVYLVLLFSICALSCTDDHNDCDWSEEKIIEVSSKIVPVSVFGEPSIVDGMLVRTVGGSQWEAYPITFIEGFEFEQGYIYTLKVEIIHMANPPQDGSDIRMKLISLISKTKVEE